MPRTFPPRRPVLAVTLAALIFGTALLAAQQPPPQPPQRPPAQPAGEQAGVEELARGPVHEGFGQPVASDPKPGPVVAKEPPAPVEEVPPAEKPAGENVAWIPGYWFWDDESNEFVWVSGFWRDLPPGRTWVPGYWAGVEGGHQWVSGYWTAADQKEAEYLPEPPQTLEAGPAGQPPSEDYDWMPGTWVWQTNRYAWRPGYWSAGYADWAWTPPRYSWTPLGYVFVDGYWDYPVWKRGVPFAPVRFAAYRPGFVYTPRVVINITYISYYLFVYPRYHTYYFGDYYANDHLRRGVYPWFAFHNTRRGYDPLYAQADRVYSRHDPKWEDRLRTVYYQARDRPEYRPPRTFRDLARVAGDQESAVVRTLPQVTASKDFPLKMERIDAARVKEVQQRSAELRKFADQRAKLIQEQTKQPRPDATVPVKVRLPDPPPRATLPRTLPKDFPGQPKAPPPDMKIPVPDRPPPDKGVPPDKGTPPDKGKPPDKGVPPDKAKPPDKGKPPDKAKPPDKGPPPKGLPNPEDVLKPDFRRPQPPPPDKGKVTPPPKGTPPDKGKVDPPKAPPKGPAPPPPPQPPGKGKSGPGKADDGKKGNDPPGKGREKEKEKEKKEKD